MRWWSVPVDDDEADKCGGGGIRTLVRFVTTRCRLLVGAYDGACSPGLF